MTEPNRALLALCDWIFHGCLPDEETLQLVIKVRDELNDASSALTELIEAWHDHDRNMRHLVTSNLVSSRPGTTAGSLSGLRPSSSRRGSEQGAANATKR